ncbi:MAG: protein jag [Oscillospiraceae bacterium]|nr:protein jag [Oscillospiraceae bacterium]
MTGIFTASSIDEAKQKAADAFGVPVSAITFQILEEPKRSLLGGLFGKKEECRIEASYTPVVPTEEETTEEIIETVEKVAETKVAEPVEETSENAENADEAESSRNDIPEDIQLEKLAVGAAYLESILKQLAPDVKVTGKLENGIFYQIEGNGAGSLIGRRGDTLDAMQYLTSMVANRGDRDYVRVTIDTCGYREKRKNSLRELAQRISKSVLRTGKSVALEPMNPYERRVIHSAVTEIDGVSSHSVGEEPNRKIIITNDSAPEYKRDDKNARSFRERGKGGRRDRGDRRDRRPSGEGPRKLDLSTSFEKDYKRPKPEDSLNAGVYGKIDI